MSIASASQEIKYEILKSIGIAGYFDEISIVNGREAKLKAIIERVEKL